MPPKNKEKKRKNKGNKEKTPERVTPVSCFATYRRASFALERGTPAARAAAPGGGGSCEELPAGFTVGATTPARAAQMSLGIPLLEHTNGTAPTSTPDTRSTSHDLPSTAERRTPADNAPTT
ncbi:hypothetical protein [Agromyces binzhouensis]|uniref:hypothetical protein n=1 Tax=Agromyces binzhouensis TaxID=1817495 RepID=UPI00362B5EF9